jgi:DNA polymerase elongation subunit (family B)
MVQIRKEPYKNVDEFLRAVGGRDNLFFTSIDYINYERSDTGKSHLAFRGYKEGKKILARIYDRTSLFVTSPTPTKVKNLQGEYLEEIEFFEGRRMLKIPGMDVYGNDRMVPSFLNKLFPEGCQIEQDLLNIVKLDIEVESDKGFPHPGPAERKVTAITIKSSKENFYRTWAWGEWDKDKSIFKDKVIRYTQCEDEVDLLARFLTYWKTDYPDIITGWNVRMYDVTYLVNRYKQMSFEPGDEEVDYSLSLSPWGLHDKKHKKGKYGKVDEYYWLYGIQQIDYLELVEKFGYITPESFKLDAVANFVLGKKKLDYSEYGSLNMLYKMNHQKFIDYNIIDVELVDLLDDEMGLMSLAISMSNIVNCNIIDVFSPVIMWDILIYNILKREKIEVPQANSLPKRNIEGGHVKTPEVGNYKWVVSVDYASLYPHLMMQYNMSPETISKQCLEGITVDGLLNKPQINIPEGMCMSATGQLFDARKDGIFPKIIDDLYAQRSHFKDMMLDKEREIENTDEDVTEMKKERTRLDKKQHAIKIMMNSLYGASSNEYFRYFDQALAEAITVSGQLAIRWAEKAINEFLNKLMGTNEDYVIAIDTDSLYINMEMVVEKFLPGETDKNKIVNFLDRVFDQRVKPMFKGSLKDLQEYMKAPYQKMDLEREVIAEKAIWTGKKHYVMNVWDKEGTRYAEPKLKIVGLESVKSSTPGACREMIKKSLSIVMNKEEADLHQYIDEQRKIFNGLPVEDISFPRGVNNLALYTDDKDWYMRGPRGTGCPIAVRAAIVYNFLIRKFDLEHKYEMIYEGSKIKFCYLMTPNPIGENVIGFPSVLPEEFGLHGNVDFKTQFEKAFFEPMRGVVEANDWHMKKPVKSLMDYVPK